MVTSDFRPGAEIRHFRACALENMQYNCNLWPNRSLLSCGDSRRSRWVGEKTVETGGRIRDMTEKLIGEIFSTRGQGTQVDIKNIDEYGIPWVGM